MTTDRELLEGAAKAAGIELTWNAMVNALRNPIIKYVDAYAYDEWNPLTDDGDALRLAVKVLNWPHGGRAFENAVTAMYATGKLPKDPYTATRRAIVSAAYTIHLQANSLR